ncbi:MAG: acetyl-CoA hydrolase/transferase C-terminal domain-containing protein [Polyangiales bacterium]
MSKLCSAEEAIHHVNSNQRVFVHGGAATPSALVEALVQQSARLRDVELIHLHTSGDASYARPEYARSFRVANLFVGENMRGYLDGDRVDYLPCFLSEIPQLFRSGRRALDIALVQVSPPDKRGYCSLGVSVDVARAAVDSSNIVIAQVNRHMPRVHGDGFVHIDQLDWLVEHDEPLPEVPPLPLGEEERAIGHHAASLIEDGATLQMGIGAIPDAVLASLSGHRHLGVHTEMWSDGLLPLLECGAVDNSRKVVHPGRTVSGFVIGTRRVYDYIDDNPTAVQYDIGYVNRVSVINRNPKVTAINSAVEIDLTGQVCADSIGHRVISGVGGQMDFIRGAMTSVGGKPIIALTSRTKKGVPRIVPTLRPGAGVVTTRAHVQFVITENGAVDLYGKTLNERAQLLISISHPDDQEALERAWCDKRA